MGFFDRLFNYNREEEEVRTALEDYKSKHDKLAPIIETLDACMKYIFRIRDVHDTYTINDVFISFLNYPKKENVYVIYYGEKVYYQGDYSVENIELLRRDENGYNFNHGNYETLLNITGKIKKHTLKLANDRKTQMDKSKQFVDWLEKVEPISTVNDMIDKINTDFSRPLIPVHEFLSKLRCNFNTIAKYQPDDKTLLKESGLEFRLCTSPGYNESGYPNGSVIYSSAVYYKGKLLYDEDISEDEFLNNVINMGTEWYEYFKKIRLDSFRIASQEGAFERFKRIHKYFPNNYVDENYHIEYKLYYKFSDDYYPSIEYITIHDMTNGGKCVYYYDGVKDKIEIKKRGKWVLRLDSKMKWIDYNKKENERKAKEREYKRRTGDYRP